MFHSINSFSFYSPKLLESMLGVILANSGFWCDTPWIPSQRCGLIFIFTSTGSQGVSHQIPVFSRLELTLCVNCLNDIKCTCRLLKANQAASEYERELINFMNPKDYPERILIQKLRISKDFPKKTTSFGNKWCKSYEKCKNC